ncbi:hypothetical protein HDU97_003431 [Phlyctochytrium planicorne]|nr:hypothetical protein HDU97_003431 [Phlyctochytrium planicorne]
MPASTSNPQSDSKDLKTCTIQLAADSRTEIATLLHNMTGAKAVNTAIPELRIRYETEFGLIDTKSVAVVLLDIQLL